MNIFDQDEYQPIERVVIHSMSMEMIYSFGLNDDRGLLKTMLKSFFEEFKRFYQIARPALVHFELALSLNSAGLPTVSLISKKKRFCFGKIKLHPENEKYYSYLLDEYMKIFTKYSDIRVVRTIFFGDYFHIFPEALVDYMEYNKMLETDNIFKPVNVAPFSKKFISGMANAVGEGNSRISN